MRLHDTTLYNSIFRFDDDVLVNMHAYGAVASKSPVMHVRRIEGGRLFAHYMESFERVWNSRQPAADRGASIVRVRSEMGRRIDYLNDPDAPKANSLVPSVNVGGARRRGQCC